MEPDFWMDGKFKTAMKSQDSELFNESATYSYKAS